METQVYLKNVTTLEYNADKCTGCSMCINVCPHNVFSIQNHKATIVHKDRCMECGACVKNCPEQALHVKQGVGCAAAVIYGYFKGTEPNCDCGAKTNCC